MDRVAVVAEVNAMDGARSQTGALAEFNDDPNLVAGECVVTENPSSERFALRITGGFAAIARDVAGWTVELADLATTDIEAIRAAISAAKYFDRPQPAPSSRARDSRTYHLTVRIDGRTRSLDVPEPFEDQAIATLVNTLRSIARR